MEGKRIMRREAVSVLILAGVMMLGAVIGSMLRGFYDKWTEPDWSHKITYAYAVENNFCIPGVTGTYDHRLYGASDMDRYILDETVIFGPFDHIPYLEFEIADTDLVFDTDGLNICDDYVERFIHATEERQYCYEDVIVGLAATLYEDGEIYVAVKFYKTVADSYGRNITVMMDQKNELSDEDYTRLMEEQASGRRDYFLAYAMDKAHITLEYREDYLSIIP